MLRPLVLRNPVSSAHSVASEDTVAVKRALDRLGLYRPPENRITDVVDGRMFAGLKTFQRRRGLLADGVAEPGGPTEAALNEDLLSAARARGRMDIAAGPQETSRQVPKKRQRSERVPPTGIELASGSHLVPRPGKSGSGLSPGGPPRSLMRGLPRPDRDVPQVVEEAYGAFGFDPEGFGEKVEAARNPVNARRGQVAANEAEEEMRARLANGSLPPGRAHNDAADAFRHALWNYKMAKRIGPEAAKRFGDAHEISAVNDPEERLMDLYNNEIGRRLAVDPRNRTRPDEEVVMEALRDGVLRTKPFVIAKP